MRHLDGLAPAPVLKGAASWSR